MRTILLLVFLAVVVNATTVYQLPKHSWRLQELTTYGQKITDDMKNAVEKRIGYVHRFISRFGKLTSSKLSGGTKDDYVNNPLPAFLLVRRLREDWTSLASLLSGNYGMSQLGLEEVPWPTYKDLDAAAVSVLRAQWTYNLDISSLATGVIPGNDHRFNVTAADCFHMADTSWRNGFSNEALEWLKQAYYKVILGDSSFANREVMQYFALYKCFSGDAASARAKLIELYRKKRQQKPPSGNKHIMAYVQMALIGCIELSNMRESLVSEKMYESVSKVDLEGHKRMCHSGENISNKLRCRYLHYHQPHLRFQPFKVEELQVNPPVLRFYEVISDNEGEFLMESTKYWIRAAKTLTPEGEFITTRYRTSHTAWIPPGVLSVSDRLTRRMADMTQLNVLSAEMNQMSRYSTSGEYLPHYDYLQPHGVSYLHDRIATLMFYLNDVRAGGNTIFLYWNLIVSPVKNSAILWFNYKPSGEMDETSKHSGCPILQGRKWVMNKWIHNNGNEFTKQCGLHPDDSFTKFYIE